MSKSNLLSERNLTALPKLDFWKGNPVGTIHNGFKIRGEWKETVTLGDNLVGARFCVVDEDMDMPILGLDWMEYYKAYRDWNMRWCGQIQSVKRRLDQKL